MFTLFRQSRVFGFGFSHILHQGLFTCTYPAVRQEFYLSEFLSSAPWVEVI